MKLLLDTHIFLWFITNDRKLSKSIATAIKDDANHVFVSVVTLWEMIVKHGLGKLPLHGTPELVFTEERMAHRIDVLPLDEAGVAELAHLPKLHRDPFDRLLISQAISRSFKIVTVDSQILKYQVPRF